MTEAIAQESTPSLLRLPGVVAKTGMKKSSIYQAIQNGKFPPPIKLSERSSAWPSDEIDAWIAKRIEMSRNPNSEHGKV
jgi:prophage regulatory protein